MPSPTLTIDTESEAGSYTAILPFCINITESESVSNDGDRHRVDPLSDGSVPVNVSNQDVQMQHRAADTRAARGRG